MEEETTTITNSPETTAIVPEKKKITYKRANYYPEEMKAFVLLERKQWNKNWEEIAIDVNANKRLKKYRIKIDDKTAKRIYNYVIKNRLDLVNRADMAIDNGDIREIMSIQAEAMQKDAMDEIQRNNTMLLKIDDKLDEMIEDAPFKDLISAKKEVFNERQILEDKPTIKIDLITSLGGTDGVNKLLKDIQDEPSEDDTIECEVIEPKPEKDEPREEDGSVGTTADTTE